MRRLRRGYVLARAWIRRKLLALTPRLRYSEVLFETTHQFDDPQQRHREMVRYMQMQGSQPFPEGNDMEVEAIWAQQ